MPEPDPGPGAEARSRPGRSAVRLAAGHTDRGSDAGATTTYVRAAPSEVATALAALTGEPHPLAMPGGWSA